MACGQNRRTRSPTIACAIETPHSGRQPSTRRPAGSFLGGFRTPALGAHANSHDGPASETLHRGRRPSERTRIVTTGRHPKPFTASVMRRLSLNRSEPAKKSGQDIPKNRCRTTPSPSSRESDFCARLSGRLWRSPMADDNLQHRIRSESEPARDIRWVRRPPSPWRARAQPICRR